MEELREKFREAIEGVVIALGEETVTVKAGSIVPVCRYLKEEGYTYLSDVTGVDLGEKREPRFQVLYHLYSIESGRRIRLKVNLPGSDPEVESVTSVWKGANWFERAAYDLFGIEFPGHPDLTRILLPDDFEGYPLRKDYPVRGR
jgi:NADH-quinone oxidoreductase subunit C